jgi:hypothetical protein
VFFKLLLIKAKNMIRQNYVSRALIFEADALTLEGLQGSDKHAELGD